MLLLEWLMYASYFVFFFNYTATTEIYPLSLHDALPISAGPGSARGRYCSSESCSSSSGSSFYRSEEHTSELQSHSFISYPAFCLKKKTVTHSAATLPELSISPATPSPLADF